MPLPSTFLSNATKKTNKKKAKAKGEDETIARELRNASTELLPGHIKGK
jgi:hypothetical protein